MHNINKFLKVTRKITKSGHLDIRPRIICEDGFSISVQASSNHYCDPRSDLPCEFKKVELGYPSAVESSILKYAEDPDTPTDTVYGFVPVNVVNKILKKHGGIKSYS